MRCQKSRRFFRWSGHVWIEKRPCNPSGWKIPHWGSWVPSRVRDRHMLVKFAALSHLFEWIFLRTKVSINKTSLPGPYKKKHILLPQSFPTISNIGTWQQSMKSSDIPRVTVLKPPPQGLMPNPASDVRIRILPSPRRNVSASSYQRWGQTLYTYRWWKESCTSWGW